MPLPCNELFPHYPCSNYTEKSCFKPLIPLALLRKSKKVNQTKVSKHHMQKGKSYLFSRGAEVGKMMPSNTIMEQEVPRSSKYKHDSALSWPSSSFSSERQLSLSDQSDVRPHPEHQIYSILFYKSTNRPSTCKMVWGHHFGLSCHQESTDYLHSRESCMPFHPVGTYL